jgi:tetratricopeptide (TPR) repeat protein
MQRVEVRCRHSVSAVAVLLAACVSLQPEALCDDGLLRTIEHSNRLVNAGRYVEAERILRAAYLSLNSPSVPAGMLAGELGFVNRALGRSPEAESLYNRSATMLARLLGDADPAVLRVRSRLVSFYLEEHATGHAERLLRTCVRPYAARLPDGSLLAADILHNEATLCYRKHDFAGARRLYELVLARLGAQPQQRLRRAIVLNSIGSVMLDAGNAISAKSYMQDAAAVLEGIVGPAHPEVGTILLNIAYCHARLREYAEAESLLHRAIALFSQALSADHQYIGIAYLRYSSVLAAMKRKGESKLYREWAQEILAAAQGTAQRSRHVVDVGDLSER